MSHTKPETPEEKWAALEATVAESEARELEDMTEEEVDAELAARGFDLDRVKRDGEALAAKIHVELAALDASAGAASGKSSTPPAAPAKEPPSNVVPFPASRSWRARSSVLLIAAAIAATLAITTATMIARRDPPPPSPRGPVAPEVFVEAHAEDIAAFRAAAEAARQAEDWEGCVRNVDAADQLVTHPTGKPDPLRRRCIDEGVAASIAGAKEAAGRREFTRCVAYLDRAARLAKNADAGEAVLRGVCEEGAAKERGNVKVP